VATVSLVINTLNEALNIERCIKSAKDFVTDIVVVDMHSDDDTQKIAKSLGATVFEYKRMGYVEPARNFAISKAKGEWILILDADEELPTSLKKELQNIVQENVYDYVRIPRKNVIFNKWIAHSGWWPDYTIRFFRRDFVQWNSEIHSIPLTQGKGTDLKATENFALLHHNYQTVEDYLIRLNRYTSIQADALSRSSYVFSWSDFLTRPSSEFVRRFFSEQGYRDGVHGLALSLLQSFSELILVCKLWQSRKFKEQTFSLQEVDRVIKNNMKDINYWFADSHIKSGNSSLTTRLKRKFKLP
jgi:(heptosyl)LPS beta-1,4-glucosyltransferase